jgi:secretory phospholipase A2
MTRICMLTLIMISIAACAPELARHEQASVIDLGNFIAACYAGDPPVQMLRREYWDYGCYCGKGGSGTPVDATDECCKAHDECWAKVKQDTGVSCYNENYANSFNDPNTGKPTTDCSKWTFFESCSTAKHPTNNTIEEIKCCDCDLIVTKCFQRARGTYNPAYVDWSDDDNPGASCGPAKGKSFACQSGYIARSEPCTEGTKRGNRLIGYWCEATCDKPEVCQTSSAKGNAYARCAPPTAPSETCATTLAVDTMGEVAADNDPCIGTACDECPFCDADDRCSGNHAPSEPSSEWPVDGDALDEDGWAMPDAGIDEPTPVSNGT